MRDFFKTIIFFAVCMLVMCAAVIIMAMVCAIYTTLTTSAWMQ